MSNFQNEPVSLRPGRPSDAPLNSCDKGIPGRVTSLEPEDVASRSWNVLREDLPLPAALLKREALNHNRK
jgi:D-serine dehydratase